jgi:hypothetical protein
MNPRFPAPQSQSEGEYLVSCLAKIRKSCNFHPILWNSGDECSVFIYGYGLLRGANRLTVALIGLDTD